MPVFQLEVPTWQTIFQTFLLRNTKGNFDTLLLYKKFCIILHRYHSYTYHMYMFLSYIKIVLYFISIIHVILRKSVCNFAFLLFFSFLILVRNENIKRSSFYTLQVTWIFSNFPQLKQLNKIKNTCEYCVLLELWSTWVGDPRYCGYVSFRFLRLCFRIL